MKLWSKVVIGDGERGLLYRNRRFERVLAPGMYRLSALRGSIDVRRGRHRSRAEYYAARTPTR